MHQIPGQYRVEYVEEEDACFEHSERMEGQPDPFPETVGYFRFHRQYGKNTVKCLRWWRQVEHLEQMRSRWQSLCLRMRRAGGEQYYTTL